MKRVIRKSEDLPERATGFVEPAASLPSWIIGNRMILWIQRDIPRVGNLDGFVFTAKPSTLRFGAFGLNLTSFLKDMED